MVRVIFFATFIFALPLIAGAQQTETLFSGDISHGGYGGLVYGATSINGELAYLKGFRGAWIINLNKEHSVNLGWANYKYRYQF